MFSRIGSNGKFATDGLAGDGMDSIFRRIGVVSDIKANGTIVFEGSNLTQADFDTLSHIRINNITGQIFDDRMPI